ncbi:MAG TPA: 50S ribosomal protein L9 [bacterium]|nr:50S ribosomal protein L9 [bacterium]
MKVILLEDVENLGDKNEVKSVATGYARNFLIPRGLAEMATASAMKQLEERLKYVRRREERIAEKLAGMRDKINGTAVEISAHAGKDGKLYGSITNKQIAAALSEKLGLEIDKRRVYMEAPLKQTGDFSVVVDLSKGNKAEINVRVVSEDAEEEEIEKKDEPVVAEAEAAAEPESVEEEQPEEEEE